MPIGAIANCQFPASTFHRLLQRLRLGNAATGIAGVAREVAVVVLQPPSFRDGNLLLHGHTDATPGWRTGAAETATDDVEWGRKVRPPGIKVTRRGAGLSGCAALSCAM
ncbi:hypothetical protein CSOJ01_05623 [Colletotrichum sojae]|uniref:Uncharacterized protein n=1 Tax=Colletotrichum sojae TaxID=2175907 RepID=A0A8H6MWG5_9PEZI|nr:hypothetical protein CSOJ01_05623 [Colletotrichum sojae]